MLQLALELFVSAKLYQYIQLWHYSDVQRVGPFSKDFFSPLVFNAWWQYFALYCPQVAAQQNDTWHLILHFKWINKSHLLMFMMDLFNCFILNTQIAIIHTLLVQKHEKWHAVLSFIHTGTSIDYIQHIQIKTHTGRIYETLYWWYKVYNGI